jgi:hypothetical protein
MSLKERAAITFLPSISARVLASHHHYLFILYSALLLLPACLLCASKLFLPPVVRRWILLVLRDSRTSFACFSVLAQQLVKLIHF